MARLIIKTPNVAPAEIHLAPGRNCLGREGENDFLIRHESISRKHCEVWVTEDAVLVRDLASRNGTFIDGQRVAEAEIFTGQSLALGDVEMLLAEAPVKISVPDLPLPPPPKELSYMPDGSPCCFHHDGVEAKLECTSCKHVFCGDCVRELRIAGGLPRRFCTECGGLCERLSATVKESKRGGWLGRIVDAFTKPTRR